MSTEKKNPGGRPRIVLDERQKQELLAMAQRQCSDEEMAAKLGVAKRTLQAWKKAEWYQEITEKGRALGRSALRSAIFEAAVVQKNPTMMIWASKNILGWSERVRAEHTGANGAPMALTLAILDAIPDAEADPHED